MSAPESATIEPTQYSHHYYDYLSGQSLQSARRIVPAVIDLVRPRSVVDVGCGEGAWASVFAGLGVQDVMGLDGTYIDPHRLLIPATRFQAVDLVKPFELPRKFDLAVCLEVAEHLPEASAAGLVKSLARCAPVVLFSAAIPGQGGVAHINEQWPAHWAEQFAALDFECFDILRSRFWDAPDVNPWYQQNMMLFVRRDARAGLPGLKDLVPTVKPAALVHPGVFASKHAALRHQEAWPQRVSIIMALGLLWRAGVRRVRKMCGCKY